MSSGNRRKGGNNSRRGVKDLDEDFNRSSKLLVTRNGTVTTGGERQLFNPSSDNPIAFNKAAAAATTTATIIQKEEIRIQTRQLSRRSTSPPLIKRNGDTVNRRPPPASGRKLRSATDDSPPVVVSASAAKTAKPAKTNGVQEPSRPIVKKKVDSSKKEKKSTGTETAKPLTEEEQAKELQRKKWKSLVASLRTIETKLETLTATSRNLSCFNDEEKEPKQDHNRRQVVDQAIDTQDIVLVEQDVIDAEKIWKEKIQLHLSLGEKYLEILNCDLEYAEKKGLESLCWKRAVYSLVDQFRRALKKPASDDAAAAAAAAASAATTTTNNAAIVSPSAPQSELVAMLFDDDKDEFNTDNLTEIPVINEGGGLTFIRVEKPKPTEAENQGQQQNDKLHQKQTNMILTLFLEYLDLADGFYQKLTLFLKSVDDEEDNEMENYLNKWRRTRKYKWYTCIPLRGDLARYRWTYTPNEIVPMEINNDDMTTQAVTKWTNYQAFQEAWKRYFLGIWLMPAKGNLYFNLSLLLQQKTAHPGYEFHKLYFSTRSLMVRRNGFLNARESMLVLFEGNRRWIHKHLQVGSSSTSKQNKKGRSSSKLSSASNNNNNNNKLSLTDKDATIPALFVRLHGMLFTKIGLDEFSKIKRLFFDELFYQQKKEDKSSSPVPPNNTKQEQQELSQSHIFWFETIITCLSSLYTYDYANSKLTELLSSNSVKLFYPDTSDEVHHQQHQTLLEDLGESILFTFEIDLICQIAVQLFQRYIDAANLALLTTPVLPKLPHVSLTFRDNKKFLFGDGESKQAHLEGEEKHQEDTLAWLVYIEILLHWMVLNGICIRSQDRVSLWESLVGDIGYDFISHQQQRHGHHHRTSKISSAFWPLLLQFLNKILGELPEEDKYTMVNKHFMDNDDEDTKSTPNGNEATKFSDAEYAFARSISTILGQEPDLPEEDYLRGLGWVDEIHGRFIKLDQQQEQVKQKNKEQDNKFDTIMKRKVKILDYGFTLVKHLDDILYYDPVEEIFTVSKSVEERAFALDQEALAQQQSKDNQHVYEEEEEAPPVTIAEMDDDVLLSSETEFDGQKNEGDDIMTQLKKRREQLQSIVASAEQEERFGYRRLPARAKEREIRLNYLRKCIIPGKTILVLDTNCFIGHIDHVQKLLQSKKWSVIVPLVVVTELDGLRTNPHRLGTVAQQGIELLECTLAAAKKSSKSSGSNSLRIQTSHNNFMYDISIRSEQFVFGETDKNLDDLILSSCLWWISQQAKDKNENDDDKTVPVCLVTGDRNLSVKARARDVEVVPVSAITLLTPKD